MFKKIFIAAMCLIFFFGIAESRTVIPKPPAETEFVQALPKHKHNSNCKKTTAEPVQIICILDRSGSMSPVVEDTIGGYNSFLAKQKENSGAAEVTTVLFDNLYEKIADAVNLQEIAELTSDEYYARGTTALLDAIGMTITETLGKMESEKICPEKRRVLVMIMTDGLENASKEYNKKTVKSLIEMTTKNYKWNYIFLGANMDSVSEASKLGISSKHAANFEHDSEGVERSFDMMSKAAEDVRNDGAVDEDWSNK